MHTPVPCRWWGAATRPGSVRGLVWASLRSVVRRRSSGLPQLGETFEGLNTHEDGEEKREQAGNEQPERVFVSAQQVLPEGRSEQDDAEPERENEPVDRSNHDQESLWGLACHQNDEHADQQEGGGEGRLGACGRGVRYSTHSLNHLDRPAFGSGRQVRPIRC